MALRRVSASLNSSALTADWNVLPPSTSRSGGSSCVHAATISAAARAGSPACEPLDLTSPSRISCTARYATSCVRGTTSERPAKSVRNGPGSTISTRMPNTATSVASASEKPSTAHFVAL